MPKNVVCIPHTSILSNMKRLKIRGLELSKELAKKYNVYVVSWFESDGPPFVRLFDVLRGLINFNKHFTCKGVTIICLPCFPIKYFHRLMFLANLFFFRRAIKKLQVDAIINQSLFYDLSMEAIPYVYDMADDYFEATVELPFINNFLSRQIEYSKVTTTISSVLSKKIKDRFQKKVYLIPNGVSIPPFAGRKRNVRDELGLEDRFVIGSIGNHGKWSGIIFLIDVFKEIKKVFKNTALLVVGNGPLLPYAKQKVKNELVDDVIFTGPINPDEVHSFFTAIDVGVVSFDKTLFTDSSLPIKILEYLSYGKIVIATPLEELQRLRFRNVFLIEQEVQKWVDALMLIRNKNFDSSDRELLKEYEWHKIAEKLSLLIEGFCF